MQELVIRVSDKTAGSLKRICDMVGHDEASSLLADASERRLRSLLFERESKAERRANFYAAVAEDYKRLRADPVASAEYDAEHAEWDVTLGDGLENDPYPLPDDPVKLGVVPDPAAPSAAADGVGPRKESGR